MIVKELKLMLELVPDDATVHVIEGNETGIVIRDPDDDYRQLAYFQTKPMR